MKNRLFVVAGLIAIFGTAWYLGRSNTVPAVSPTKVAIEAVRTIEEPVIIAMTTVDNFAENIDLSRAFLPNREEEVSEIVLASFMSQTPKSTPAPASRYRAAFVGIDSINPIGMRLGWLSIDLPATDVLDIMPREVAK